MGLVKSRIQIKWSGSTTVSAKGWTITITSMWGGWWDTLWTRKDDTTIQPASNTDDVSVWSGKITLMWSWTDCSSWYPTIWYDSNLMIQDQNLITCSSNYIRINQNWIWLGTAPSTNYKLNVNWGASINWNHFKNNRVWIQKNLREYTYNEPLQIGWWIQIWNKNSPSMNSGTNCNENNVWAIEYHDGFFYWCVKKNNNDYKRGKIKVIFQEETTWTN